MAREQTRPIRLDYRLPLTFVRIVGARHELHDRVLNSRSVSYEATVTTETGADLLTRQKVLIGPIEKSSLKATWTRTPDGLLAGTDVTTTVDSHLGLKAAVQAGMTVAGAAAPLLAAGPPGWIAFAATTGLAAAGAGLSASGLQLVEGSWRQQSPIAVDIPEVDATAWQVPQAYVNDQPEAAKELAHYRAAMAAATARHAQAVYAAVAGNGWTPAESPDASEPSAGERGAGDSADTGTSESDAAILIASSDAYLNSFLFADSMLDEVKRLERLLASIEAGAAKAEEKYQAWYQSKRTTASERFDERLRIDGLPGRSQLENWAKNPETRSATAGSGSDWERIAHRLRIAVSVDLEPDVVGTPTKPSMEVNDVFSSGSEVMYRQPRAAVLRVWKILESPGEAGMLSLQEVEVRRLLVAHPGNEATIDITAEDSSRAVALEFDASGALTKITTDLSDASLERARGVSSIITTASDAAAAGADLRKALSPPSLVERAAERKAAKELGLVPTPADPLQGLRSEVEEAKLRAQLQLAEQMSRSTSVPVLVQF